jgi:hypothetical protein
MEACLHPALAWREITYAFPVAIRRVGYSRGGFCGNGPLSYSKSNTHWGSAELPICFDSLVDGAVDVSRWDTWVSLRPAVRGSV